MPEEYTLRRSDVDACRRILGRLEEIDAQTGGYRVGSIQGHRGSATATVHYENRPGAVSTGEALAYSLESVGVLGHLCRKVIAHCETHPEAVSDG